MRDVPKFFSIIERKALQRNKIQIPKKIVRKCGDSLKKQACFKLPCGLDWKIGLTKSSDGKVWFDKGWCKFSKHYSIGFGHFLVFGYKGDSQFQVIIFNDRTIEIDYKSFNKDDESVDTLPSPCATKARKKPRSPPRTSSHQSHGKMNLLGKRGESEKKSTCFLSWKSGKRFEALKSVTGFESNLPSFICRMTRTYVQTQFYLNVPRDFAEPHLGRGIKAVKLKAVNGKNKSWQVKYSFNGSDRPVFGTGWRAFTQDNAIKIGDICAFAMIKTIKGIVFEVTIYRGNGKADSTLSPMIYSKETKASCLKRNASFGKAKMFRRIKSAVEEEPDELLAENDDTSCKVKWTRKASEAASKFHSKHPFFQVDFPSSRRDIDRARLPISFARSYLEAKTQIVSLRVGKRSWDVTLLYYHSNSVAKFSQGWPAFVIDNSLRPGDSCIFELIKRDQVVFEVSILWGKV